MELVPESSATSVNLWSRLMNTCAASRPPCVAPAPFHTQTWLCVRSGWRLPTLAVFQPLATSDSVGDSVMAQREPRTPLCRFRLLSLPYRQKNWGEFFASEGSRESKIYVKSFWTFIAAPTQHKHTSISQGRTVNKRSNIYIFNF